MSQKSIATFFKPVPVVKRSTSSPSPANKRHKSESVNGVSIPTGGSANIKDLSAKLSALHENIGPSWFKALEKEFEKPYFHKLSSFIEEERKLNTVYPDAHHVYSWTHHCDINEVRVVILGQDPYHGVGQAHGLAFSVQKGVRPPPSLLNIFKELQDDLKTGFRRPSHGDLTGWAKQGVLLLNASLTVRKQDANSHSMKGWEKLTDAVIQYIDSRLCGVVFMLWGAYAQKKCDKIDPNKHIVLKSVHPSPLSAHRGFLGCKHFSQANAALRKLGKPEIDWSDLP
ncbi:Uracil-DNA glycosylase [Halotydeus destructor]|nr:Uracil-DNA glycosylase [Halotydeus destructor]